MQLNTSSVFKNYAGPFSFKFLCQINSNNIMLIISYLDALTVVP